MWLGVALPPRTRRVPKPPPTGWIQMLAAAQTDAKAAQPVPRSSELAAGS